MVEVRDLVAELRLITQHQEAMREAFGNVELLMVLFGEGDTEVTSVGGRIGTQVNGYVIDCAFHHADELTLGIMFLKILIFMPRTIFPELL